MRPARRKFVLAAAALPLAACYKFRSQGAERGPIAAMFPGPIDDGGFMEAGYRGLLRIRDEIGIAVGHVADIAPQEDAMQEALRELADSSATMVIACGDRASAAVQRVAWEFPEQRFTVIQGEHTRPNLAIYGVRVEQSSWLAGAAAGLLTRSNVVGHVGGRRSAPALKARAAFAAGLAYANAKAKLLTNFSGAPDDPAIARHITQAEIDGGADIVYAMLGAGRIGAIAACRERGVGQIGSVRDWVAAMPDVFIASAVADPGAAMHQLGRDIYDNLWKGDLVKRIGVRNPAAVRLALADAAPAPVKNRIVALTQEIAAGTVNIPDQYAGAEFNA